jgi:hypothetical protein
MSEPTTPPRGVIDDAWEQELTAGQEAAGEHGDLEADLAMLHLLRHARAPEVLGDEALEEVLEQLKEASAPASTAWWRRRLVRWVAVPACAGLAVVLFVRPGAEDRETVATSSAQAERAAKEAAPLAGSATTAAAPARRRATAAKPYEQQFAALERDARASLRDAVVKSRSRARHEWLASLGTHSKREPNGGTPPGRGGAR